MYTETIMYITFLRLNLVVCRHYFTKHVLCNNIIVCANHCNVLVCTCHGKSTPTPIAP